MITRLAKSSWWFLWYKMRAVNLPRRTCSPGLLVGTSGPDDWSIPGALLCSLADLPAACIPEWIQLWKRSPTSLTFPSLHTHILLSLGADTLSFLGQWWALVNIGSQKDLAVFFYSKHVYLLQRSLHLIGMIFFIVVTVLFLSTGNALWSSLLYWGRAGIPWRISNVQCNWLDINIWVLNI